jgi:hypothetical protein
LLMPPLPKTCPKTVCPRKGVAFLWKAFLQKNFRCGRRFRYRRLRSTAVTRLWPRGLRSRRPHSSLISGLLGLEGISKRKQGLALPLRARRRTGSSQGPGPVRPSSGRRRRIWGRHSECVTISIRTRTGQSFGLRGVAQTAARLSAKLRARLSPGPVFR